MRKQFQYHPNPKSHSRRLVVVLVLLAIVLFGLLWRLLDLNLIERHFLLQQSNARIVRKIRLDAHRGMIVDRLGVPLAISSPVDSVWINPDLFLATSKQKQQLAKLLAIAPSYIKKQVHKNNRREFIYLKRRISPSLASKVKALKIPGVFLQREYKRFYPEGEVTAHVVGMTNVDDQGQEGLELAYNHWLSGQAGLEEVLKDRMGRTIADVALLKKPQQGRELVLSLDHRIQYSAYRELRAAMQKHHAQSGSIVVLNVKTGEILAMVNQPSYNPNNRPSDDNGRYRNRAVTDTFEPGSVIKPFNIAFALESGKYTSETKINTNPGWMEIGGYRIEDAGGVNHGVINLTQVLQESSNIAAAKILLSLQPKKYWNLLHRLGFGQRTRSGFPGEAAGSFVAHNTWYPSEVATSAYGYGISVTTLQLAHAYAVLADHGLDIPVTFLKVKSIPTGKRVIDPKVADEVVRMMEAVIKKGGTGTRAAVPGYLIAGKTGTAYIAGANGYNRHKYMASFVGIAPAEDPQLVIAVAIREPQGHHHFGGGVAAPVFSKVMAAVLRILDISPDTLPKVA